MSESELLNRGKDVTVHGSEDEDEDVPQHNPILRGWNRYAAEGYSIVNNNKAPHHPQPIIVEDEAGSAGDQQHKTMNRLCVILVICIIIITGLLIIIMVISLKPVTQPETCQSPDCVMIAGSMLSKMELSADPCDDFYAYACNVAIEDPTIPPSAKKWGVIQQVAQRNTAIVKKLLEKPGSVYRGINSTSVEKAKFYYFACMNITARESRTPKHLLQVVNDVGSWPLTNDPVSGVWSSDTWSIENTLAKLFWYKTTALFTMTIGADDKNSSVQRILLDQGGTCFSNPDFYAANDSLPYHAAFVDFFVTITTLLGANETTASSVAEDVWQFEQALANAFDKPEDRLDPEEYYHRMSVSELQGLLGSNVIDFHTYLENAIKKPIDMSEEVVVYAVDYIPKMAALVQAADKETLASYMVWHVIITLLPYMPLAYRMPLLQLESVLTGVLPSEEAWEQCVSDTESAFGFVTGALFVENNFSKADKLDVTSILSEIRQTFVQNLPSVTWMDRLTRHRALVKADGIIQKIGYPEFIRDPVQLDDYYAKVTVHKNSQFRNALNVRSFQVQLLIDKLGVAADRNEWHMMPEEVNAYYSASLNEIVFPAGILQKPFYDSTMPRSLLFGGIGMVMGHELSHGFDNQGRLYDIHGNLRNWWTNHSAEAFLQKSQCFINEYNNFTVSGEHINGKTTLAENIADNAGLKTAYKAYKSWSAKASYQEQPLPGLNMTDEQMFFLGFAQLWCAYFTPEYAKSAVVTDSHTNNKFRVIGTLRNMPEFAKAYHCTHASPMNPQKKCSLW